MIVRRFGKSLPKRIPPRIYTYISKRAGAFVARLRDIDQNPHRVQKTHDLYDARYSGTAKFIFIYGDPLEAALSAANMVEKRGVIWLQEHMYHLSTKGEFDDLFRRDLLNFGEQVRTWSQSDPKDVLILSFDELWDAVPAISAFVGLQITLPARQPRAAKPTIEDIDTRTFAQLLDDAKSTVAAREHQEQAK
jgi:hypothetical protein